MSGTHAIVPLALLEAVQHADQLPDGIDSDGFGDEEGGTMKFGRSATVAAQVNRYRAVAQRNHTVALAEVSALLRLVARRSDAALVFADAGRRAGRMAADRVPTWWRVVYRLTPTFGRDRVGRMVVRRAAGVFDVEVRSDGTSQWSDAGQLGVGVERQSACDLLGAATAELLRQFTSFDGAVFRVSNPEDTVCRWTTNLQDGT